MAAPGGADQVELSAIVRVLASEMRTELLILLREILERNAATERLTYSPEEAAELLGISRELAHDLLRTGQLGSVKAGRRGLSASTTWKNSWPVGGELGSGVFKHDVCEPGRWPGFVVLSQGLIGHVGGDATSVSTSGAPPRSGKGI
jgi:excisionase family DNA binding protein